MLFRKKASISIEMVISIALISLAFLLIFTVIKMNMGKAEAGVQETLCRGSICGSEMAKIDLPLGYEAKPDIFLCEPLEKEIDVDTKEGAKKQMADAIIDKLKEN